MGVCPNCGKQFSQDNSTCPFDGAQLMRQLPDPMIGTRLPRNYRITGKLGRGAMSVVYAGIYEPLNQPVAIKLLKSHLVSDLPTFKRFQQEAKTAGALEHPNIVGIFDFGVTNQGVPYLIMELLQGESLAERFKRSKGLSVDAVISLFAQAADALFYTHERGIIHRDVKPSNILIVLEKGEATVKIVDFGIAKMQTCEGGSVQNELTGTGEVFGTPLYVSPEQAMGRTLDARADIYSLGCVMYEAIVGRPPFNAPTAFDVIRMQITEPAPPLQDLRPDLTLPPSLVAAVERCMQKDPALRFQTMAELHAVLQQAQIELSCGITDPNQKSDRISKSRRRTSDSAIPTIPRRNSQSQIQTVGTRRNSSSMNPTVDPLMQASPSVAPSPPVKRSLAARLFNAVASSCILGCLAGVMILVARDFVTTLDHAHKPANNSEVRTAQSAVSMLDYMNPKAAKLLQSAQAKIAKRQYKTAEDDCLKALAIAQANNQADAQGVIETELCTIYTGLRDYKTALKHGQTASLLLSKRKKVGKSELRDAMRASAIASYHLGEFEDAQSLFEQALQLDDDVWGRNHALYISDLSGLGRVYEDAQRYDKAEESYRQALSLAENLYGRDDKRIAASVENLGRFLTARKRTVEARAYERRWQELSSAKH